MFVLATSLLQACAGFATAQGALDEAESQLRGSPSGGPELLAVPPPSVSPQQSGYLGIKADEGPSGDGIRIVEVVPGGPADVGGLRPGDLISAVQGGPVRSVDDFAKRFASMSAGTHVTFDLLRDNEPRSIEVVLGRRQADTATVPQMRLGPAETVPSATIPSVTGRPAPLGIRVEMLSEPSRRALNVPPQRGVRVTRVTRNSAAEKSGIPVDAVILSINGQPTDSPDEAAHALSRAQVGRPLSFSLNEAGQEVERQILPEAATSATVTSSPATLPASTAPVPRVSKVSQPQPPRPAELDSEPAERRGGTRPLASLNSTIDEARANIRRLEQRVAELEKQLQLLQRATAIERDDAQGLEDALEKDREKIKPRVVPIEP
jgi:hypothetical protein